MKLLRIAFLSLFLLAPCATAAPLISNGDFAAGLSNWSSAGTVTTSSGGALDPFFPSYAIIRSGAGVSGAVAEGLLGLSSGTLTGLSDVSFVYQDLVGPYDPSALVIFGLSGLANQAAPTAILGLGIVDLATQSFATLGSAPLGAFTPGGPFDGFAFSFGPLAGPFTLETSNPARLFALIANAAPGEDSALAIAFAEPAPEMDPSQSGLPVLFALISLALLGAPRPRLAASA